MNDLPPQLRDISSLRYTLTAALVFASIFLPCAAYQKYADPPGDRLAKWHFAGVEDIDLRGTQQAIREEYAKLTWREIIAARRTNAALIFQNAGRALDETASAIRSLARGGVEVARRRLREVRIWQFLHVATGAGLAGLLLFVLPLTLLRSATRPVGLVIGLSLAFWVLSIFGAGKATLHVGSYFPEIALVVLAVTLAAPVAPLAWALVALHSAITAFQYLLI